MKGTILDRELLDEAVTRSARFLEALPDRAVAPEPAAIERLRKGLGQSMPDRSCAALDVLAELDDLASPAIVASAGPRFFGFVSGGSLPVTLAANWLASAWDQNSFSLASSPAGVILEETALRWLQSLFGFP